MTASHLLYFMALILIQISPSIQSNNFSKEKASANIALAFSFQGEIDRLDASLLTHYRCFQYGLIPKRFLNP